MITVSFACDPADVVALVAGLITQIDAATLEDRIASIDADYRDRCEAICGRLKLHMTQLSELGVHIDRLNSEIESLLDHDHTHASITHPELVSSVTPGPATPDSEVAHEKEKSHV